MNTETQEAVNLLTEKQAAKLLGCCERTVSRMRKDKKLRCVKIGAAVRYSRDELNRFIDAHTTY